MKRNRILLLLLIVLVILTAPTFAQDDFPPEPTPTMEVLATEADTGTAPDAAPISVDSIIVFAMMGVFGGLGLGMTALVAYLTKLLGNSVQTKQLEGLLTSVQRWAYQQALTAAARTSYEWDDNFVKIGGSVLGYDHQPPAPNNPPLPTNPTTYPRGIPLNRNTALNAVGDNGLSYYEEDHDGRKVAIPHGYKYRAQQDMIGSSRSPHPEIYYVQAKGFEAAIAFKAGRFGYSFVIDNFVLGANQRFAVIVSYEASYAPEKGTDGNPTLYMGGTLMTGIQPLAALPQQVVVNGSGETQWVMETSEEIRNLTVAVGMYIPWAVIGDGSTLTIKSIKFIPVADDYGSDVVLRV